MNYSIEQTGPSGSFPEGDAFFTSAAPDRSGDIVVGLGGANPRNIGKTAILVELGDRFLADFIGLEQSDETLNVVGFMRYCNGRDRPSTLVELVHMPWTSDEAIDAAKAVFAQAALTTALCTDQPGRIIDRLVLPKYNAALRFLDEGLATQADMDLTCRMGLGYRDGPLERVIRGGLDIHHDRTLALFDVTGISAYAPPRAAKVAARARKGDA